MKKLPEITYSDWMQAMDVVETVPDDWMTVFQISKQTGMSKDTVLRWIQKNPEMVQIRKYRIVMNGTYRRIPHYRLENGKAPK